jgi:hypothetical protein
MNLLNYRYPEAAAAEGLEGLRDPTKVEVRPS